MEKSKSIKKFLIYVVLAALSIVFILPLVWMLITSLKSYSQNLSYPPTFIPRPITFENYSYGLFEFINFFKYFGNSVFITLIGVVITMFSATFVAYGFARIKVRENKYLFWIVLATMMLPTHITMISSYVIWSKLGVLNGGMNGFTSYIPLLIGSLFGGSPFYIFLTRQFFAGIPKELEEAACIDGCTPIMTYFKIFLPLSKPILATIVIFSFQGYWNDFMGPLIYVKDVNRYTLAQALTLFNMPHEVLWGPMMAASVVTIIPVMVLFAKFQKYFLGSITISGIKG